MTGMGKGLSGDHDWFPFHEKDKAEVSKAAACTGGWDGSSGVKSPRLQQRCWRAFRWIAAAPGFPTLSWNSHPHQLSLWIKLFLFLHGHTTGQIVRLLLYLPARRQAGLANVPDRLPNCSPHCVLSTGPTVDPEGKLGRKLRRWQETWSPLKCCPSARHCPFSAGRCAVTIGEAEGKGTGLVR